MKYLKLFESNTVAQDLEEIKTFLHDIQDTGIGVSLKQLPGVRTKFSIHCGRVEISILNSFEILGMLSELHNRMVGLGYGASRNLVETGENGNNTCYFSFEIVFTKSGEIKRKASNGIKSDITTYDNFFSLICKEFSTTNDEVDDEVSLYSSRYLTVYIEFEEKSKFRIIYNNAMEYDLQDIIDEGGMNDKDVDWLSNILDGDSFYDFSQKSFNMLSKMVHLLEKYNIGSK